MSNTKFLIIIASIFGLLAVILFFFDLLAPAWFENYKDYKNLAQNLIVELIGAALIIFFVDWGLRVREERATAKVAKVGLEAASITINRLIDLFAKIVKASSTEFRPKGFKELFGNEAAKLLSLHLDINKRAPVVPNLPWRAYLAKEAKSVKDQLASVCQLYQTSLPEDSLASLGRLLGNSLLNVFEALDQKVVINLQYNIPGPVVNIPLEQLKPLLDQIANTVDVLERETRKIDIGVKPRFPHWIFSRNDLGPKAGDSRFDGQPGPGIMIGKGPPPEH